jgi:hypothetical protein
MPPQGSAQAGGILVDRVTHRLRRWRQQFDGSG